MNSRIDHEHADHSFFFPYMLIRDPHNHEIEQVLISIIVYSINHLPHQLFSTLKRHMIFDST